jgi:parallel beta-helix repeat protein
MIDFRRISFRLLPKETLMKKLTFAFVFAALALTAPAHAETVGCTPIPSLPWVITVPGVYCFTGDLITAQLSGNAIEIQANQVIIDLNGHRLGGGLAGLGTLATGIYASKRQNITIKNGTARGFFYGIWLDDASPYTTSHGHVIEDIRADQNTVNGISVAGNGNIIRNNQVVATGGTTLGTDAYAYGIQASGPGAQVLNNMVTGVAARGGLGNAFGILMESPSNSVVAGNRIGNLTSPSGSGYGIYLHNGSDIIVRDNSLSGMQYGIYFVATGAYMNNLVRSSSTPYTGGTPAGTTNY